ncbi:NUDIX hydrolase [Actinokineospora sp. NBRC 105648]|uniref:NUDIX hydrolase n=1 Tax=Actinokineospora sp. NBRC 105648 TaxID=3032206 RepID=UPI00249FB05A|nr:NUDIX hydrolase [Actinokineospora sp. NBRC 105648]GLZ41704.1 NUDIX hydrolase [Actinokineospora sp. NBRC 105648]
MSGKIAAAGAVLWRGGAGGVEVAVVHRPRYDDWSLPKGKLDRGESTHAAAVREVAEETGFAAVLGRFLARVSYRVPDGDKTVDYFAARAAGGAFEPNDEVDQLRWLPVDAAADLCRYPHDRVVLHRFTDAPADTTTVLLVRHAHAGKKQLWTGPDAQRPLSPTGERQSHALTRLLPLFGPDRVHSVPKVRCTATVAPLAAALGVPVVPEPTLSEQAHEASPGAATARLLELAKDGGTPVVCSQGGVIPDVLADLLTDSRVEAADLKSRKGSVWVLSFDADARLVAADYIPTA